MENAVQWTIGGAIEHGAFLMALASALLTTLGILIAISGVIAYIRIRSSARAIAAEEARSTAESIAEKAANDYLQAEIPAIIAAYSALGQSSVTDDIADEIAENQDEGR